MFSFLRSFRSLADMFRPPFDGLWLLVTLYYAWAFLVYPHSPVMRGEFPDTDDYMYLNQVLDWMKGQGWYDNIQHRLDPPAGVPIHFSRLAQLPMAGLIALIELLGLGPKGSATIMAMIYPIILLGCFFLALRWVAESLMPKEWAGVTSFVGLFALQTLFLFEPGHVDHHNLIVILEALTLGCVLRMIQQPEKHLWPLYTGIIMAFGMVIALEILPWLLLLSAFVGLWAVVKGGHALRGGLLYALSLFVTSAAGLLLTRPSLDLFNLDVLTYSVVYVILAGGIAVTFACCFLMRSAPLAARLILGSIMAVVAGLVFLQHFPELIAGPYGGIDPALARIILDEINEAQPFKTPDATWLNVFWVAVSSFVALPLGFWFLGKARGVQFWCWSLLMLMMLAMTGLAFFYQRRFIGTANMLQIFPLAVMLQRGWGWVGAHWQGRPRFYAEMALILLAGPLPAVLVPALADGRNFNTGVLLFPVALSGGQGLCQTYELENALRNPLTLGNHPRMIMSPIGMGPELLFRTQHKILAAPYHMDVEGNVDSTRFFSTPYPDEAEAIVRRRHIDLVISCMLAESFYFNTRPWDKAADTAGPGKDFAPHFIERLISGHIPAWLKPVKVPGLTNYVIYEVLPPEMVVKTK